MLARLTARVLFVASFGMSMMAGCDDGSDEQPTVDVDALRVEIDGYRDTLVLANPSPLLGSHGALMSVWAPPDSVDQYVSIDPEDRAEMLFPTGTLIVKEHLDNLEPFELSIMYKGPAGYNPEYGDWWFGEIDVASGELTVSGPDPIECVDCHASASVSDYVHGLPPA